MWLAYDTAKRCAIVPQYRMYRSPPKCGSLCNTINDIGKSRYQQYSWTNTVFRFDFGSFSFSSFLFFFSFFFFLLLILLRQETSGIINASILTDLLISLYIKNRRKFSSNWNFLRILLKLSFSLGLVLFLFLSSLTLIRKQTTIRYCSLMYKYIRV